MCIATQTVNGPRRCAADARDDLLAADAAVHDAERAVARLRDELTDADARPEPNSPPVAPTQFAGMKRDERVEAMRAEIDSALAQLNTPEAWQDYLECAARMPRYSLNNLLLIRMQNPDATWCGGAKNHWEPLGRHPRKGCKAIWILAPRMRKITTTDPTTGEDKEVSAMRGTVAVPVFDVDQTEGKPLPSAPIPMRLLDGDAPPGMHDALVADIEGKGFEVSYEPLGATTRHPGGYTDFTDRRVVINSDRSPRQKAATLAHELAHIECGHGAESADYHVGEGGQRNRMEIEAESVAFVISRRFGLEEPGQKSFGYIAGWSQGDNKLVASTAENVCKAVRSIFERIEPRTQNPQ